MRTQLVIFGASGDLTSRKLVPALLGNFAAGGIGDTTQIVGVSRSDQTSEAWRESLADVLGERHKDTFARHKAQFHWIATDASVEAEVAALARQLDALVVDAGGDPARVGRLFYLALAPNLFGPVVDSLAKHGLLEAPIGERIAFRRIVLEKPFGTDLASARALNHALLGRVREDQLFRIDHYLGKETVQNILAFRFQNAIFEPLWNRNHVESVEISVCEQVAMEGKRGAYYDGAGAMRDMVQNHLMQVLALVAMEPPGTLQAEAVRGEKVKVVKSLRLFNAREVGENVVRAQYAKGPARDRGYHEEVGVSPESKTETYVAIRAMVDNWRWSGVPFLLRTGKAMERAFTEVVLRFKTPPVDLLHGPVPEGVCALRPNALRLLIQPQEGVRLSFLVKQPGAGMVMRSAELGFDYKDLVSGDTPPAYQRLLLDALEGNATLFLRGDELEAAWAFVDAIRTGWDTSSVPVHTYAAGSRGPDAADALFHGCEGIWSTGK